MGMRTNDKTKISLRPHLKIRLKERKIPGDYPEKVIRSPNNQYIDSATNRFIAVKKLEYNNKIRPMVVVYDIIAEVIQIITIHPISETEIKNKLASGRWKNYEKN